jgi:hypothetical protein
MPELSKLLARYEALDPEDQAAEDAKALEGLRQLCTRMDAYIEEALEGVSEQERQQFDHVPIHRLREAKRLFLPRLRLDVVLQTQTRATTRPRERRERRTARTVGSRGDPPEDPDLAHRYDREIIAAVWRCKRAKAGKGYQFRIPPGAAP